MWRHVILAQQRALDLNPGAPMLRMRMDVALESFRSMLDKAIARERSEAVLPVDQAKGPAQSE